MYNALLKISKQYMTPEQIQRSHARGKGMGPSYEEELEMAYENIQNEARFAIKGFRLPKPKSNDTKQANNRSRTDASDAG